MTLGRGGGYRSDVARYGPTLIDEHTDDDTDDVDEREHLTPETPEPGRAHTVKPHERRRSRSDDQPPHGRRGGDLTGQPIATTHPIGEPSSDRGAVCGVHSTTSTATRRRRPVRLM